jgi:hypothetical protein
MSARRYTRPRSLRHLLDRLADQLDAKDLPAAPIHLWEAQFEEAHQLLHYQLLSGGRFEWRGHPLVKSLEVRWP